MRERDKGRDHTNNAHRGIRGEGNRNRKLEVSTAPRKAKLRAPA